MRLPPLPSISDVIRLYKLSAAKKLSQNFIMDMSLNHKIVAAAGNLADACVCEVGPGPGGITRALLEKNINHLHVIEKDSRFMPGLQMLADASGCLTAYQGDVLRFKMDKLFPESYATDWSEQCPNLHIIGNLPFSVSLPLLFQYMENISTQSGAWKYGRVRMTLTFQKEVAERIVAQSGDSQYCRVSPLVQNYCHVKIKHMIPGSAFVPAPNVDIGLVSFTPRKTAAMDLPYHLIVKVTRHLFHHKNKMCKNNFKTLFPEDQTELLDELLMESNTNPSKRPLQFSMDDIVAVCQAYDNICKRYPYILDYDYRNPSSVKSVQELRKLEYELGFRQVSTHENTIYLEHEGNDNRV